MRRRHYNLEIGIVLFRYRCNMSKLNGRVRAECIADFKMRVMRQKARSTTKKKRRKSVRAKNQAF